MELVITIIVKEVLLLARILNVELREHRWLHCPATVVEGGFTLLPGAAEVFLQDVGVTDARHACLLDHAVTRVRDIGRLDLEENRIKFLLHLTYLFCLVDLLIVVDLGEQLVHSLDLGDLRFAIVLFEFTAENVNLCVLVLVLLLNLFGQDVNEFLPLL